jgi:two-component system sensor histidine kinase/response regulator
LAVSTQLVNLMGGRIGVRSELGKGSIFHFTIAFDVAPGASDGVVLPDDVDLNGLLILVVDDNATNLKILCEMLTSWKINPKPASSVTAGAAMIRKLNQHGKKPHLAIIDSDLPQSDALSLVRQIRQENAEKTGVIAMLTTTTTKETDRFYEAGAGAVLTKPVRPSELLDAIIQVLSMAKAPVDEREGSVVVEPEFSLTSMNVLVAEDTPFNQKYIRRLLDNWGSKTTIVSNGRQAVEMLADREFDIVLMDVQMPEMDGLTATARIRRLEKQTGRHVPIIAMTAHAMQGDRERCLEAGMDDYVPKPISSANLKEAIQRLAPAGTQAAVPAGAADAPAAADEPDELKALLEAFDNDSSLFQEIAGMFISDYPTMLETIQEAIAEQDGPLLGLTAHALKGIARNFQVDGAADAALHLEALARQEQFIKAREVCRQLTGELTAFENRLKRMMDRIAEA